MGQYVIEFVSPSVEAIFNVLEDIVRPIKEVQILTCAQRVRLDYQRFLGDFPEVLTQLERGIVCSVVAHSHGQIRCGLVTCPNFNGQDMSAWMGTIEVASEDWQLIWNRVLAFPNLQVACVGLEEGIDLTDHSLSLDTFPWREPSLLAGAVRGADGSWRHGSGAIERE
jgi:hypothetical protein